MLPEMAFWFRSHLLATCLIAKNRVFAVPQMVNRDFAAIGAKAAIAGSFRR